MEQQDLQAIKQRFGIIGNSPLLNRGIEVAVQVAPTDLSVLITGESGVGKENFPKIIHAYSLRRHKKDSYFAVNCGAIPKGTLESELFGHEKGAFTDARAERKGYFEIADGGTLFLDEVGELPLETQAQLLRVLETGEFMRVGSSQIRKTNVRVVAATNLDMKRAISEGRFREDLYYRLNTVEIKVPALRDRKDDIPLLFRKFVVDFSDRYRMPAIRLTEEANEMLKNYYWNGNVRQLKNVAEQISIIEKTREISADTLRKYLPTNEMHSGLALLGAHTQTSQDTYMNVESVSTGSLGLDIALGIGGVPRGRIIEIYGPESSGKTTLLNALLTTIPDGNSLFKLFTIYVASIGSLSTTSQISAVLSIPSAILSANVISAMSFRVII